MRTTRRPKGNERRPGASPVTTAGMTLLEVMIALTVLVIGASTAAYGLVGVSALVRASNERALATEAAQNVVEAMQGEAFAEVFVRFNATAGDDPPLGVSPGNAFPVPGLEARPGDADGLPGEILFPGNGVDLLEGVFDVELGMPRDLGGVLGVDPDPHNTDYRILPLLVRVRWRGASGDQEVVLATTLSNDKNVIAAP
jgi:prepilin-type N-terminal cleavage/methylation domain-containing protein